MKFLSRQTLDILYKLTVRSVIDYGLILYSNNLNVSDKGRLEQVQYRAAKLCSGALHFTNREKFNTELGWESIENRAKFLGLSLFHKIKLHETRPLSRKFMPQIDIKIQNTRYHTILKPFPPLGLQFSKSFFPHFTSLWNDLETNLQNEPDLNLFKQNLKSKFKPKKHKHFMKGSRRGNALLTQLRVGRSFLNYHGYSIGLTDSPACLCDRQETVEHYLLNCFLFTEERRLLLNTVEQLLPNFKNFTVKKKIDILLFGINIDIEEIDCRNVRLTLAVQKYILDTKCFSYPSFQPLNHFMVL